MRAAISLIITSLLLSSLAVNSNNVAEYSAHPMLTTSNYDALAAKTTPKKDEEPPTHRGQPRRDKHRGSGRQKVDFIQHVS